MSISYKTSGVDLEAGEETVKRIKPLVRSTFSPNVLADIGLFGGFYDASFPEYKHPVLVASTDGVGTKLEDCLCYRSSRHSRTMSCQPLRQ